MSKGSQTYVVNHINIDSGGLLGEIPAWAMVYIELLTGRKMSSFAEAFTGLSIGAIVAAACSREIAAPAVPVAINTCGSDLFRQSFGLILGKQVANELARKRGLPAPFKKDHIDFRILENVLDIHFNGARMNDAVTSLLMLSHNMTLGIDEVFGKVDPAYFDVSALKKSNIRFTNGETPIKTGILASTSIPVVGKAHKHDESRFQDLAPVFGPSDPHRLFIDMLRARHDAVRSAKFQRHLSRRFWGSAAPAVRTFENAKYAAINTYAFGTGDISGIAYDGEAPGIFNAIDNTKYNMTMAMKNSFLTRAARNLQREYETSSRPIDARDGMVYINRSIVPRNAEELARFPSTDYTNPSADEFSRRFDFAVNYYVRDNRALIAQMLTTIARLQMEQGKVVNGKAMDAAEYRRISLLCDKMVAQEPMDIMAPFKETVAAAQKISNALGQEQPKTTREWMGEQGARAMRLIKGGLHAA